MSKFTEKVAAGIARLDERGPLFWRGRLRTSGVALDMSDGVRCVLGQLFGSFWSELSFEFLDAHDGGEADHAADRLGFAILYDSAVHDGDDHTIDEYAELTEEWLRQLQPANV